MFTIIRFGRFGDVYHHLYYLHMLPNRDVYRRVLIEWCTFTVSPFDCVCSTMFTIVIEIEHYEYR